MRFLCYFPDERRIFRSPDFDNLPPDAFYKYVLISRYCPHGEKKINKLRPDVICNDRFYINYDESDNTTKLVVTKSGKKYNHFTIYTNDDGSYWADHCFADKSDAAKDR